MPAESEIFTSNSDSPIANDGGDADADRGDDMAAGRPLSRSENLAHAERFLRRAAACPQELFADAFQATAAAKQVEQVRRLSFVTSVVTLHDMAESRVSHEHGHASSKVMYLAVNKQSSRDVYGIEQVRKMLDRCHRMLKAARKGRLSEDHLRLLSRVYANRRVRDAFVSQQAWFLKKARRFDFKAFEILVNRWLQVNDDDGPDPNAAHQNRSATCNQDVFGLGFTFGSTQAPLAGATIQTIFQAYIDAEFAKDWEAAKAVHGDKTCTDLLERSNSQRAADAFAQVFYDAADNPKSAMPVTFVHGIVWSAPTFEEMARRHAGYLPQPFDLDTYRCETIDGTPLDPNEAFLDALMNPFRRVVMDAKRVVIDISEKRFFTGLARTALQIAHPCCEWPGCHVPASRCQSDHIRSKVRGGPTTQENGTMFCGRHNRHKERGYTVWRDSATGQIRIITATGQEITEPWDESVAPAGSS